MEQSLDQWIRAWIELLTLAERFSDEPSEAVDGLDAVFCNAHLRVLARVAERSIGNRFTMLIALHPYDRPPAERPSIRPIAGKLHKKSATLRAGLQGELTMIR